MFQGKVAIITGGTSGIGAVTAKRFADEGANVVLTGRRADEGNAVAKRINDEGGSATFVKTDIRNSDEVSNMVSKTVEIYGRLDYAVNNAGIEQYMKPLVDQTEKVYDLVMNTNVKGVWLSMREEIPAMLESGGGSIVNMSSMAGKVGFPNMTVYVASKHAVIGLTKSAALEYAGENIRVNSVLPGLIETPMTDRFVQGKEEAAKYLESLHPVGRLGKASEIAEACVWLCSDKSSYVTGASLEVDGGFTAR